MKVKKMTNKTNNRKTWVGLKPRKEATKKERIEKARKKHLKGWEDK